MAGPNLPVNIDAAYPDSATDASVKLHQQYHDGIHALVNQFDVGATPTNGQVWAWNAALSLYQPTNSILPAFTANQGLLAFNRETTGGTYDALPAGLGNMAVVWIGPDDPTTGTRAGDLRYRLP